MKKVLYAGLTALTLLAGHTAARAQSIVMDTAWGGQLVIGAQGTLIVPAHDTVTVKQCWGFGLPGTAYVQPFGRTFENPTATPDTVVMTDTMTMTSPTHALTRMIAYGRHSNDTSNYQPVDVTPIWIAPTFSAGPIVPNAHGGTQVLTYNSGYAPGLVYVYVSPGDTSLSGVFLVDTFTLTGTGTRTYVHAGYPSSYHISDSFVYVTAVDTAFGSRKWTLTLPSGGAAYTSDIDSTRATVDSVYIGTQVLTNGLLTTVVDYYRMHDSSQVDSVVHTTPGASGMTPVIIGIGGLATTTAYDFWRKVKNSAGWSMSDTVTLTTSLMPTVFSIAIDSMRVTGASTQRVRLRVNIPVGMTAQVSTLWAEFSDPTYAVPVCSPAVVTLSEGVTFLNFDCPGLVAGQSYRVTYYAFPSAGPWINPNQDTEVVFTFTVPIPTVTFTPASDTVYVGGSTLLHWSTMDATAVTITGGSLSGPRALSGSTSTGALSVTTNYVLHVTGLDGTVTTHTTTVFVVEAPNGITEVNGTVRAETDGTLLVTDVLGRTDEHRLLRGEMLKAELHPGVYVLRMRRTDGAYLAPKKVVIQ